MNPLLRCNNHTKSACADYRQSIGRECRCAEDDSHRTRLKPRAVCEALWRCGCGFGCRCSPGHCGSIPVYPADAVSDRPRAKIKRG